MPKCIVSICVPTYNRASSLKRLLESFVEVIGQIGSVECQLCVSDNASSDETETLLRHYVNSYPSIKCGRNATNLGFGRNLYCAADLADGDYIFFCGDDDVLRGNALELLLESARTNQELILFNSHPGSQVKQLKLSPGGKMALGSAADYFRALGIFHGSFIGNLLFSRKAFLEIGAGREAALSAYPHMVPVFKLLARDRSIFVNSPVVDATDSQRDWKPFQPVYTSIDMARLITENVDWKDSLWLKHSVYARLFRSLPKAIWRSSANQTPEFCNNPYGSVSRQNICEIYSPSQCSALLGIVVESIVRLITTKCQACVRC